MYQTVDIPSCKVMLMDDHILVYQGLTELLRKMLPNCEISCHDRIDLVKESFKTNDFLYLLTDLIMPGQDVRQFILYCRKEYPNMLIIIISSVMDVNIIREYLAVGIMGFLSKSISEDELKRALELSYKGRKYISSDISSKIASNIFSIENSSLTKKELEVLRLVAGGHKVSKIAETLFVSPVTIMTHRRNILAKLGLHSGAELVKYAYDNNLN